MRIVSPFKNLKCPDCKSQCLHLQIISVVNADQISDCEFSSSMTLNETLSFLWDEVYSWCCQCEWEGDVNECETK